MTLIRTLVSSATLVTHTFYVGETATDASVGVNVTVKRLDGTTVTSGAATHPGTGQYSFTVPAQSTVDTLTVDWVATSIGGAVVTARDYVEVVGGFLFGIAEARALPPALDATLYPTALLQARRIGVEVECERICGRAFVPRFSRRSLIGNGTPRLPVPDTYLRSVRAVTVAGTALTQTELDALLVVESGAIRRVGSVWPVDTRVVVEYEHGMDFPPDDIRDATMLRLRSRLAPTDSGVPQRAISFTIAEGGVYRLSTPGKFRTGIPDVDGVYEGYSRPIRTVFA